MKRFPALRIRLLAVSTVLALVAAACGAGAEEGASRVGGAAVPTTLFDTFDGTETSLAAFAGQPVVVNFWASWCPSCVAEMSAAFKPVQEELGEEVLFVGMNIQDERVLALQLLEETGVEWLSAEDPTGDLYIELGGLGMPFTVYISSNGQVIDTHNGPLSADRLRTQIAENLLG